MVEASKNATTDKDEVKGANIKEGDSRELNDVLESLNSGSKTEACLADPS